MEEIISFYSGLKPLKVSRVIGFDKIGLYAYNEITFVLWKASDGSQQKECEEKMLVHDRKLQNVPIQDPKPK